MFLKDIIFPKHCLSCGHLGSYICTKCQGELRPIYKDICIYCGRKSLYGLTHPGCRRRVGIDGFICVWYYNNILKRIIKNIKYGLTFEALEELILTISAESLSKIAVYKKFSNGLYLQPIPLHKRRIRQRGFNQADIIVKFLARLTALPSINTLTRKKETLSQASLKNKKQRLSNLRGAFEVSGSFSDYKNYILVDDVVTTGSTVKEAAATLKRKGAVRIYVFALAKG